MSFLIDFEADPKGAFARGFVRGMASPVALFANSEAPALPQVPQVTPPSAGRSDAAALASDWVGIGRSMHCAVQRHEQEAAPAADAPRSGNR